MTRAYENGKYVAQKYGWTTINCVTNDNLRTIEDIHEDIWKCVEKDV